MYLAKLVNGQHLIAERHMHVCVHLGETEMSKEAGAKSLGCISIVLGKGWPGRNPLTQGQRSCVTMNNAFFI